MHDSAVTPGPDFRERTFSRLFRHLPAVVAEHIADEIAADHAEELVFACGNFAAEMAMFGERLTPREMEVIRLLGSGRPLKLVADRLGIANSTAEKHRGSVYRKLGVHSVTAALACLRQLSAGHESDKKEAA
jgi:DNA-binding CsgD family transcriptional regulator